MARHLAGVIALLAAAAHGYFAWNEMLGWGVAFVARAAPGWLGPDAAADAVHVAWAAKLAFNIGAYNLMLAAGLGWAAWALWRDPRLGRPLALFLAAWMLVAALAAWHTGVLAAFMVQAALGLALLAAAALARPA